MRQRAHRQERLERPIDDRAQADDQQSQIPAFEPVQDVVGVGPPEAQGELFGHVAGQDEPAQRCESCQPG